MKTLNRPTNTEAPKLHINRPLVPIDEFAEKIGVTRGIIEQAAELGIVNTRKFKNRTYVLDVPVPEISQIQEAAKSNSQSLEKVTARLLKKIEKKHTANTSETDYFTEGTKSFSNENLKKFIKNSISSIKNFLVKINFRIELKDIFTKRKKSKTNHTDDADKKFQLPAYPKLNKINTLQRLRIRDILFVSPLFKAVKNIVFYSLMLVLTLALLANLWFYTYNSNGQVNRANTTQAAMGFNELNSQYTNAKQEIEQLQGQLENTKAQNSQLQSRIENLQNRITTLNTELSVAKNRLNQLEFQKKKALERLGENF
jgi:DNA repair exonuclease SbcCD ATPase subunit